MTDLSPAMVDLTRDKGITTQQADVHALPFEDGAFDARSPRGCSSGRAATVGPEILRPESSAA
jgi:hypothetical protein